jgi:L-fuconolactonase
MEQPAEAQTPADAAHLTWLALTQEEVLEPELPIIDAHHHLWDAQAPRSLDLTPYVDEDGQEAMGGAHVARTRPGGGVDPAALGWQRRYLCDELAHEVRSSGHCIEATVFVECGSMYRVTGPPQLRCVGETEFVHGVAAMAASGAYGRTQLCAAIVPTCDLLLGVGTEPVLLAHKAASARVVGVRAPCAPATDSRVAEAMAMLAKHHLHFELAKPSD